MISPESLRKYPFFVGLSEEELKQIAMITQEQTYGPSTYLCHEGNAADKLYMVVMGRVEVQINTDLEGLERETVSTRQAGDICSWSALADPYVLTASVFCPDQVTVLEIDAQAMWALCEENCHMGYRIMQKTIAVASQRFKDTRIQLLSLMAQ